MSGKYNPPSSVNTIVHQQLHMDNMICTPHLGYVEKDNYESLFGAAFDHLLAFAAGDRTQVANPDALKRV